MSDPTESIEIKALFIVVIVSNGLSILGSLLNIILTYLLRRSQENLFKMVLAISLMDLLNSIFQLASYKLNSVTACRILDGIALYGYTGSIIWTCCFSHSLLVSVKTRSIEVLNEMIRRYFLISTIVPILAVVLRNILDEYDVLYGYCYFETDNGVIERIIPYSFAILYCGYTYVSTFRKIKYITGERPFKLGLYPLIMTVCLIPFVALSIYEKAQDNQEPTSVTVYWSYIAYFFLYLQGFLNSFAYGVYRAVWGAIIQRCCPRRLTYVSYNSSLLSQSDIDVSEQEIGYVSSPEDRREKLTFLKDRNSL